MIVLDTNVISELMRPEPHPAVFAWVAARPRWVLFTTSVNQAEVLYGIVALPRSSPGASSASGPRRRLITPGSSPSAAMPAARSRRSTP
jgi:predicted nucleic acid-binding protein